MLDFSWSEFLIVIVVAVLAVGPKQLPEVLHGLGRIFRRMQYMRYSLTRQFDDFMEQADLKELRDSARPAPPVLFDESTFDEEGFLEPLPAPKTETEQNDRTPGS